MFWFVILLLVLGGAFYLYAKLKKIEQEILAEQEAEKEARKRELREQTARDSGNLPEDKQQTPQARSAADEDTEEDSAGLAEQLVRTVTEQPGIKQTALYPLFGHVPKRTLQYTLRELTDAGRLKREKIGNSFLLYPA
jgi:hypothetical protein